MHLLGKGAINREIIPTLQFSKSCIVRLLKMRKNFPEFLDELPISEKLQKLRLKFS